MPTPEQLGRIRELTTSPEALAFFFDQLTSPDWIPLLREEGLLGDPPEPVQEGEGVMFPFWPPSKYLARVAAAAPRAAADALFVVHDNPNPRVWWDTIDALGAMPAEQSRRFLPIVKRWIHHPWRLGSDTSAANLAVHLIEEGAREDAIDLAKSLARLIPPDGWPEGTPWMPLDDYEYGEEVPRLGRALATFGSSGPTALLEELEAFLAVERAPDPGQPPADLSFIWRPAIEDHQQNWDHERESKLVVAIRDGLESVLAAAPEELGPIVTGLLAKDWPVVRRIGLHLLVEHGDGARDLVQPALTEYELLADDHHRHELYRLARRRFAELDPEARRRFVANVRKLADSVSERGDDIDPDIVRKVIIRRWLGAVSDHLEGPDREQFEAIWGELGDEPHPDFPAYHTAWMGWSSPVSAEDLQSQDADDVADFLAAWEEPPGFGPHDSAEGLARQLTDAVAENPEPFATTAGRYPRLRPTYFNGLLNGLRTALEADKTFEWDSVLSACDEVLRKPVDASASDPEDSWRGTHITVARLLQAGVEKRAGEFRLEHRDRVWVLISRLVEDPDPSPADDMRFGPPNMEPETWSLNNTRGASFHTLFAYLFWHHRQAGAPTEWSLDQSDTAAVTVLDAHLDAGREPSVGVRAAYGWWLPFLLRLDETWVRSRVDTLLGDLDSSLELASWESFLLRGDGRPLEHEVFGAAYSAYARRLIGLDSKPEHRGRAADPVERFIHHLVRPWLHHLEMRDALPLRELLASGKPRLVAEIVEEAGRLVHNTHADLVTQELGDAYRDLWALILDTSSRLEPDALVSSLAPFAWWFDSPLPANWTLPELVRLMELGVRPNPEFGVVRRLPEFAPDRPELTLRVVELIAEGAAKDWTLRVHEGEIRQVLAASIAGDDGMQRARAEAMVHRLGRVGLVGLGSLLRPDQAAPTE